MPPYTNVEVTDKYIIREFNENIDPIELKWHRDRKDRKVLILEGTGWEFQLDNELPIRLSPGDEIYIPKKVYHRIKKGTTDLKISIEEL